MRDAVELVAEVWRHWGVPPSAFPLAAVGVAAGLAVAWRRGGRPPWGRAALAFGLLGVLWLVPLLGLLYQCSRGNCL
ncbi:MAG TPA: hypothetical protein VKA84_25600 [Gemmatimonadaceae bacterium]|nr:hypothetical protein [Gemmatimonadaceae bacterium]